MEEKVSAEAIAQGYQGFESQNYIVPQLIDIQKPPREPIAPQVEIEKPQLELAGIINHLEQNWLAEGLPADWHRLSGIGFIVRTELKVLTDENHSLEDRVEMSKRNILGFVTEYLKGENFYPIEYSVRQGDDGPYLFDERYRERITATVSQDERNGSVTQSIAEIQNFMLSKTTPEGSIAVMPSPEGATGLTDNDGDLIYYPDSYWFVFQKRDGGKYGGFGLRTDFSIPECRIVIRTLTGKDLPKDATIEDYVRAVALITPGEGIESPRDFLDVLREGRIGVRKNFMYKNKGWEKTYADLDKGEELYLQGQEGDRIVADFEEYVLRGGLSDLEIQKGIAATILRLSKLYLVDKKHLLGLRGSLIYLAPSEHREPQIYGYGQAKAEAEKIPGCAGGGSSEKSLIDRLTKKMRNWTFDKDGICQKCGSSFGKLGPCDVCEPCNDKIDAEEMGLAA